MMMPQRNASSYKNIIIDLLPIHKYIYGMNLEYLRSFLETYRTGSVTGAARNLHLTQPAISNHLKALEQQLQKPLFQRAGRNIRPTPLADELAHAISSSLDTLETTIGFLTAKSQTIEGTIYVAGPGEFMQFAAAPLLSGLLPLNIRLRLRTGSREYIIKQLEQGDADLAFLGAPLHSDLYDYSLIAQEKLIPVASPEWAAKHFCTDRSLEQLLDKPLIAYDEDLSLTRNFFLETLNRSYQNSPIVTVPDLRIVMAFLQQGQGYSVLPDYLCQSALQQKKLVTLIDCTHSPVNKLHLVWPKVKLRDPRVFFTKNYLERAFTQTFDN